MPHFFFNLTSSGEVTVDCIGNEFPSLEDAYLSAWDAILEIAYDKLRAGQDPDQDSFEIVDAEHTVLMQVPFLEVLRPRRASKAPALREETRRLASASRLLLARSEALKAELCAEIERTKQLSGTIRQTLARSASSSIE